MTNKTVLSEDKVFEILDTYSHRIGLYVDDDAVDMARAIEQAVLQSPEIQQDQRDAARYRAWRQAAINDRREFIEAAEKYEDARGKGKLTEAEFDAGIDAGIAAMEQKP